MNTFQVAAPTRLGDVLSLLAEHGANAALLAGGTDLLIHIRRGKRAPKQVVLLRKVRDLGDAVVVDDTGVTFGAMATLGAITADASVRRDFPAIAEAAGKVGSEQIRNRGTLCGNVANASPAADTMPPLYVYDAVVNIVGTGARLRDRRRVRDADARNEGHRDRDPGQEVIERLGPAAGFILPPPLRFRI